MGSLTGTHFCVFVCLGIVCVNAKIDWAEDEDLPTLYAHIMAQDIKKKTVLDFLSFQKDF